MTINKKLSAWEKRQRSRGLNEFTKDIQSLFEETFSDWYGELKLIMSGKKLYTN